MQLAHGQQLQNAFFHLFQAVMVTVKNLLRLRKIDAIGGAFSPRQLQTGIQISAHNRCFVGTERHFGKLRAFPEQFVLRLLHHVECINRFAVRVCFFQRRILFPQLVGDDMQLLTKIVFPLIPVDILLDLVFDFGFGAQQLQLAVQKGDQLLQPIGCHGLLQQRLRPLWLHGHIAGNIIRDGTGIFGRADLLKGIVFRYAGFFAVFCKAFERHADHGLILQSVGRTAYGTLRHLNEKIGILLLNLRNFCAVKALANHADGILVDADQLQHARHHSGAVKIAGEQRLLGAFVLLGQQKYGLSAFHCLIQRDDRLFPTRFKMKNVARKSHCSPQRNHRQAFD